MKKILSLLILLLFFINCTNLYAQIHMGNPKAVPVKKPLLNRNIVSSFGPDGAACDTVNLDVSAKWGANTYFNPDGGFTFGVGDNSNFGITSTEDANHFDVSANDYNYISGGLVYFSYANSNIAADLDKDVLFNVYDDNAGVPGNLLGSTSLKLSRIKQDVDNGYLTQFAFSSPIALPASKVFYVSVDHSNFIWDGTTRDSIAIVGNDDGDTTAGTYQYWLTTSIGNLWIPVSDFYQDQQGGSLDVNLYIFPYVSNAIDGCTVLPVSILNFGGLIKDNNAYLNWSTATESNNKGFYVERSKDAINFSDVGFVNGAGNSSQIKNYTYTDVTVKDMHVTTTYYRLKQVDLDGKISYSKVLPLNLKNIVQWRLYPNPVKDVATVELNLTASSKVNVQVIAADGRVVINADKGILNQGTQQVFINTQNLAKGSYIVRVKTDSDTFTKTIVKE
jgi:hypothetical protein